MVPAEQWDKPTAVEMLDRLQQAGIQVRRASAPFEVKGTRYAEGSYILPAAQPFRPYLFDLMEPQRYPEIRSGTAGAVKKPYDITGWTLSLQMGVKADRIEERFAAQSEPVSSFPAVTAGTLDHRENASFLTVAQLLGKGEQVRWAADGAILTGSTTAAARWELKAPRVALYQPWTANADEGWTEWLLDHYHVPFVLLHNADFQNTNLRARFDSLILTQQTAASILNGVRHGEMARGEGSEPATGAVVQRPEYTGGIGTPGLAAIEKFVSEGGTLITFDTAAELPIQFLPLPVRNLVRGPGGETEGAAPTATPFSAPGSLIRLTVDNTNPIAFGMPKEAIAMTTGGTAFDITVAAMYNQGERKVTSVARFADTNLLASGWAQGERAVVGRHALLEAKYGGGRVVLFGFRPQFRGQPYGTFKLLLNAIYLASAQPL